MQRVLIVDDTPEIVQLLTLSLTEQDYTCLSAETGAGALEQVHAGFVGVVILDLNLPDYQELQLFHEIRRANEQLPIIIVTGHGSISMAIEASRLGAYDFLSKTDSFLERVFVACKNAFEQLNLRSQLAQLSHELRTRYHFDQIITVSPVMEGIFELMGHAVESRVTVLVEGESGTGKELVARALHYNGPRKDRPFVAINCAGIPPTLLESELFGFEKGAFTGATSRKAGKFELADGGTLFLDEIGEMPLSLQPKILRVLQEREVERLGGSSPTPINVRIICATNRELQEEVRAGRFREDLFYRLAVFPVRIPPLRDRALDVPVLAQHFLQQASAEEGKTINSFSPAVLEVLASHDFPGNVRELENIVSHAVVLATGNQIRMENLPETIRLGRGDRMERSVSGGRGDTVLAGAFHTVDDILSMKEVEARVIRRTVELCDGNLVKTAEKLGISRATLYRRIGKMDLKRE